VSLAASDLVYTGGGYTWYLRPCGSVINSTCSAAAAAAGTSNWMLCQVYLGSAGVAYDASIYNPYLTTYTPIRSGVIMTVADGATCYGTTLGARVTMVWFQCNTSATTAWIYNITESPQCTYNVYVWTSLVCPGPQTTCGGAGYDLSALTGRGDLQQVNTTSGYTWYFSPCGVVQNSVCQLNPASQSSMMCQVYTATNTTYDISTYASQLTTWTAITNGVQMQIQDGLTCNGYDFQRMLTVNFLCNQGGGYGLVSVYETTVCNYLATVNTGIVCSQLQPGSSSSSSSSLSGGAIAGIVIGCVVGVLLLIALVLVMCCGVGSRFGRGQKRSYDDSTATNGNKFKEVEASQSNVELEPTATDSS